MGRVFGAIRRAGAGTTGRVDQRDLRFWFAPAEMYRGEHARSTTTHDRDAHHDGRLYLAGESRCLITLTMFALADRLWNRGLEMVSQPMIFFSLYFVLAQLFSGHCGSMQMRHR